MNEIRTYTLSRERDGTERAPIIGPYVGDVPKGARIIHAKTDEYWVNCAPRILIDAIVPVANVPVRRTFHLVNHGCCGTRLGLVMDIVSCYKVEAPEGTANGRLYLFEEVQ